MPGTASTTRSTKRGSAGGFLSEDQARRLVAAYGTNVKAILGEAKDRADLGPAFGPELTGAEVRYLMAKEWARFPDDILWRRTKLGLTMPAGGSRGVGGVHGEGAERFTRAPGVTRLRLARKACAQAARKYGGGLVAVAGAQTGYDQRVFPQFALGVAAADPGQFRDRRLEQSDRAVMVALGERLDAAAELDRGAARRQLAGGFALLQLRQSGVEGVAAGHRCGQRMVDVGEMRAGLREILLAIGDHVSPVRLQPGLSGQRQPPQQRGAIGEDVQRRVGPVWPA